VSRCALVLVHCLCSYDFPMYARYSVFTDSCCFVVVVVVVVVSRIAAMPLLCVTLVLYFAEHLSHCSPKLAMQCLLVSANVIRIVRWT